MVDLGTRLKELRKNQGMIQLQVAERVGISKAMVSSYEVSARQPSYEVLVKLATLYGVTTDYLLGVERDRVVNVNGLSESNIALINDLVKALRSV